jgi:hypothetical protein
LLLAPILLLALPNLFAVARVHGWARWHAYYNVAERAQPVIAAIERYRTDRGELPPDLAALVPGYLPKPPRTGLLSPSGLGYWRHQDHWGFRVECPGFVSWTEFYYPPKPGDEHRSEIELINGWSYSSD